MPTLPRATLQLPNRDQSVLEIIHYPHPTLRYKSKPIKRVDANLRQMVEEMFDLMYEHKGVGLAANQVDLPLRLFVVNETADPDQRDQEHVFINPIISRPKGNEEAQEGCLSLPEVYADVKRPAEFHFSAYNLKGEKIEGQFDGFFGRILQHETDHLDGIMFIDKVMPNDLVEIEHEIEEFEVDFKSKRDVNAIPSDEEIAQRLSEIEATYC